VAATRRHALAVLVLLASLAAGCARQRFTRQNFETLYVGMPAASVERKLGEPDRRLGDRWVYVSERPYYRAEVLFRNGRVAEMDWSYDRPVGPPRR
jgi:hypothetical protein